MEATTESINNVKMLKMYSWEEYFLDKIKHRRAREIVSLRKSGVAMAFFIAFIFFFPSILPAITFSSFIGMGNSIPYYTAVGSLVLF